MNIDRSNYEIWLIDWLDGNLSNLQVEKLKLFLSENPDLKEEFYELNTLCIKPFEKSFSQKELLKKSLADLSGSQFEYLCVAYLENDLSVNQHTELKEIIDHDADKRRTFELIQKTRLVPSDIIYKYKHKLKKRTVIQNVIRLSVIGLAAAATVTLIIITYMLIPRNLVDKTDITAQNIMVDSALLKPSFSTVSKISLREQKPVIKKQKREYLIAAFQKNSSAITQSDSTPPIPNDSLIRNTDNPEIMLNKIPVYTEIDLKERSVSNTLVASHFNLIIPAYDDERSTLSKFIAKTFREKILKENSTKDSPLKAYEIAEAGVTGLNKLLGWEMALDEKNDETGELRSVYFNSKILKFNAPVRKNEPLP
ncbi:MAG: hypothetical protein WCS03_11280 [Bacteroidota bacterium]